MASARRVFEQSDAAFHGCVEKCGHLLSIFRGAIRPAHTHAAEADGGNFQVAFPQLAFLHCPALCRYGPSKALRKALVAFPSRSPVFLWVGRFHDELLSGQLESARKVFANQAALHSALNVKRKGLGVLADFVGAKRRFIAALRVFYGAGLACCLWVAIHQLH